ncbi:MAG: hypothetical protein AB7O88_26360 [Reyranellaceae bacterium]
MSLQSDKIRDKADRALEILADAGPWLLAVALIGGAAVIVVRTIVSAP